jgi:hypothetical protein
VSRQFALDYIDVATRIVEFRDKYPDGSLQQVSIDFREVNGGWWVVYTAAAYRSPDDLRPGIGTAWEPIPGKTNFTRDNEVQNAETAAWGRAMVAALAVDTKRGIASAEEVRNSQERQTARTSAPPAGEGDVSPPAGAPLSAEAQALADLSGRLTDADSLRDLYRQAAEAHLLPELVTYGADGQVRPLAYVITSAAERVTKQAEGEAA